ncbi:hypothetical protein LXL04_000877 [Taraxacum kok-saghyz]
MYVHVCIAYINNLSHTYFFSFDPLDIWFFFFQGRPREEYQNCSTRMDKKRNVDVTCTDAASVPAQPFSNALINSVETFIFDCDGVIWKGDSLIEGVPKTLELLRSKGKRLVFVTNNSIKSRKQYGKKFETLGLSVNEEEIFASSFAAAYLQPINFPKDKKIYVIGEEGILIELGQAGFSYLGAQKMVEKKIELKPGFLMEHDKDLELLWLDLIVTLTTTTFGISKSQICMVGDRLDTDILFGQNGGCKTLLVLSGVTSLSMLQNPNNSIQPDFYTNKISDFLTLKAATV